MVIRLIWQPLEGAGMGTQETTTAPNLPIPGRNSGRGTCREAAFQGEDKFDPSCVFLHQRGLNQK